MSKLGVVIQKTADHQVGEFLQQSRPRLVKLVDDLALARFVHEHTPDTVIIGRLNAPQPMNGDPLEAAVAWVEEQLPVYRAHPEIDYWEGYQETRTDSAEQIAWFASMEAERVRLLGEHEFRACIGNFAAGTPELDHRWEAFFPAVRAAREFNGILGLHEFSAPFLQFAFGPHQANPQSDQGDEGWLTGRYRKVWRQFLQPNKLEIPIAITAAGIDGHALADIPWRPAHWIRGGWLAFKDWWQEQETEPQAAETHYLQQLIWYDGMLCQDDYVLGAAIFAVGDNASDFDLSGPLLNQLGEHITQSAESKGALEKQSTLLLLKGADAYNARYLLYAQPMHPNTLQATWKYLLAYQVSQGQSFHDAVRICRDERDVITAINPSIQQIAWLKRYTHANLDIIQAKDRTELAKIMNQRVADNTRFGPPWSVGVSDLRLKWPVAHQDHTIIQAFGADTPFYQSQGNNGSPLHGHEGWDILASEGAAVLAAADGAVLQLDVNPDNWPYGLTVRLEHRLPKGDTYQTVYGHLGQISVQIGDLVEAGQAVGIVGQSGQCKLPDEYYLHFHVHWIGATQQGRRDPWGRIWPRNLIWPGEKMIDAYGYREGVEPPAFPESQSYSGPSLKPKTLIGAQMPAGRRLQAAEFQVLKQARLEAVRFQSTADARDVDELRRQLDDPFILVQINHSTESDTGSPAGFAKQAQADIEPFYRRRVRYFEIGHQPNRADQGYGRLWQSGAEFGAWWMAVRDLLVLPYPEAKWGFPGLLARANLQGGKEIWSFLHQAQAAAELADWLGVHLLWEHVQERSDRIINALGEYRQRWPHKLLIISEFTCLSELPADADEQIVDFYRIVRGIEGLAAAFACEQDSNLQLWLPDNQPSDLASMLGNRIF